MANIGNIMARNLLTQIPLNSKPIFGFTIIGAHIRNEITILSRLRFT